MKMGHCKVLTLAAWQSPSVRIVQYGRSFFVDANCFQIMVGHFESTALHIVVTQNSINYDRLIKSMFIFVL